MVRFSPSIEQQKQFYNGANSLDGVWYDVACNEQTRQNRLHG